MVENAHNEFEEYGRNVWSNTKTKLLLNAYLERKQRFRDPTIKKKRLWTEINKDMKKAGFPDLNEEALDRKMRNLKKTYRSIKDNNKQTGRGGVSWPFYEMFEEIFNDDRNIFSISSMETENKPKIEKMLTSPVQPVQLKLMPPSPNIQLSSTKPPSPTIPPSPSMLLSPNIPTIPATPSVPATSQSSAMSTAKQRSFKSLQRQRRELLELEKKRVAAVEKIERHMSESIEVQRERNRILEKLLEKL